MTIQLIPNFQGFYGVGRDGSVWSCRLHSGGPIKDKRGKWKRLKSRPNGDGYSSVELRLNGRGQRYKVHSLILLTFIGPKPQGKEARHLDGNRLNPELKNLVWGTPAQNQMDRRMHGTDNGGHRNGHAKLTWNEVHKIRRLFAQGYSRQKLFRLFYVSPSTMDRIVLGKTWK